MKTTFLVEVDSTLTVSSAGVRKALLDYDPCVTDVKVTLRKTVTVVPEKKSFTEVMLEANAAGELAVNTYLKTHDEPMYCGVAYLVNKANGDINPTGKAGRTQSLDLQNMWCEAAAKVFKDNGIEVYKKSWVD